MADKTSYTFSFAFTGQIWQTAVDPYANYLALEVRNPEDHQLSYQLLNLATRSIQPFEPANTTWWTMILHLRMPILFLEQYGDPQDPVNKQLTLYHLGDHTEVARLEDFQFSVLEGNELKGHLPGNQMDQKIVDLSSYGISLSEGKHSEVFYPVYYAAGTESFQTITEFLKIKVAEVGCEYFEWKDYIIISYYHRLQTKFERKLLVLKGDHEIYHQVQDEQIAGFASGSFFVVNDLLVFINNGNQINGIEL